MRKNNLRQIANKYLKLNHSGSFRERKQHAYVIKRVIDDLFLTGDVPHSWHTFTSSHMQRLIGHWRKCKFRDTTIMRHMTIIRHYLTSIDCNIPQLDNQSLQLQIKTKQKPSLIIKPNIWENIIEPTARLVMALQTEFGLTFAEAIQLKPGIHTKKDKLWITREIAFNSTDRMLPLRYEHQTQILTNLSKLTENQSLIQRYGYQPIRVNWQESLKQLKLPQKKSWRYLYARQTFAHLEPTLGHYQTRLIISDEMGIKSRNSLWLYLHE